MNRYVTLKSLVVLLAVGVILSSTDVVAQEKKDKGEEVTAKEIDTFGKDLIDKRCHMNCKFGEVDNIFVTVLLKDETLIGFNVIDSKGDVFSYAAANKEKYGRQLLKVKFGDSLRLIGKVKKAGSNYFLMIEEIEVGK